MAVASVAVYGHVRIKREKERKRERKREGSVFFLKGEI